MIPFRLLDSQSHQTSPALVVQFTNLNLKSRAKTRFPFFLLITVANRILAELLAFQKCALIFKFQTSAHPSLSPIPVFNSIPKFHRLT